MSRVAILCFVALALCACSDSRITSAGSDVSQARGPLEVKQCVLVGPIVANADDAGEWKVPLGAYFMGPVLFSQYIAGKREELVQSDGDSVVTEKILIDARNQAGAAGGNRILATGQRQGRTRQFDVYHCP